MMLRRCGFRRASDDAFDWGFRFDFMKERKVNPYIGVGGTYYFLESDLGEVDDELGFYGQLGLDFGFENFRFFIEGMYRQAEGTINNQGVDADIDFTGITANAGIAWKW